MSSCKEEEKTTMEYPETKQGEVVDTYFGENISDPYRWLEDDRSEETAQWVDLYNRLYRDRILFLCQDLDDELANQLIGIMLYLNAEDKSQEIFLYINSPGGSVTCGIGVYDAMN